MCVGLANLGDSSSMILRRPRRGGAFGQLSVVKKVKEMQHGFNVPYQFAHLPAPEEWDRLLEKVRIHTHTRASSLRIYIYIYTYNEYIQVIWGVMAFLCPYKPII